MKNTSTQGLLYVREYRKAYISAQDIADIAGASKSQVLYWGRTKYIPRRTTGYNQYPISAVPKAKLMALLTNEIGIESSKASQLADSLLSWIEERPGVVDALLTFLRALYGDFEKVMTHLEESGFGKELLQLGLGKSEKTGDEKGTA